MDEKVLHSLLMEKVGKKFYGHKILKSKYIPQIPQGAEREYIRMVRAYMGLLKNELEETLPELKESYKKNMDESVRYDADTDIMLKVNELFTKMKSELLQKTVGFGLRRKLENLARLNRKLTVKEWKKAIKATLGIDIFEDYYMGEFFKENLLKWAIDNVELISTIPEETLDKMKEIVFDGYANGRTTTRMVKDIQRAYKVGLNHARLIARDQTAKLNGQIQKAQQQDAGINRYIWCTSGDERVRESHKAMNGKMFSWDIPPTNSDGRACHPGEDFQCRCIGRPVFDRDTLSLPVDESVNVKVTKKYP